jgi:hypothetical protein
MRIEKDKEILWLILRYYTTICQKELRKTTTNPSGLDCKPGFEPRPSHT